ncbi:MULTISPECIES: hypothetical protein [unclassified Chryseobacterium]|jgi:hypothetical protein|uniref:hypothetical protein n=1 Tax=unclassified Chryseobacterium TaxID=2593645 RepID=UPI0030100594
MAKKRRFPPKSMIEPQKWDNKGQKATGNSQEIKILNIYLKTLEQKVYDYYYHTTNA